MEEQLHQIEELLREKKWRWYVAKVISEIPSDYLATYGCIAEFVNQRHGLNISPRNVAWLRKYLYQLLTHETEVPLHRVAKIGDVNSLEDSKKLNVTTTDFGNRKGQ